MIKKRKKERRALHAPSADLGPGVRVRMGVMAYAFTRPIEDHPLDIRREPSTLKGWTLEVLHCDSKRSRAFLRILSAEGQGVRLRWALSKPEGPAGLPK